VKAKISSIEAKVQKEKAVHTASSVDLESDPEESAERKEKSAVSKKASRMKEGASGQGATLHHSLSEGSGGEWESAGSQAESSEKAADKFHRIHDGFTVGGAPPAPRGSIQEAFVGAHPSRLEGIRDAQLAAHPSGDHKRKLEVHAVDQEAAEGASASGKGLQSIPEMEAKILKDEQDAAKRREEMQAELAAMEASRRDNVGINQEWTQMHEVVNLPWARNQQKWQRCWEMMESTDEALQGTVRPAWLRAESPPGTALEGSTVLHLLAFHKVKLGEGPRPEQMDELYVLAVRLMKDLIDHKNGKGQTALHCACAQGNASMAKALMQGGCSVWGEHKG
jgi:hypothetical protein